LTALRDEVHRARGDSSQDGRRGRTLGSIALFHLLFHVRTGVLRQRLHCPFGDHSRIWADRRFPSTIKAVIANPWDSCHMVAWRTLLGPGKLFVDIGANAGVYSVWAADLGASVIAIEPNAEALRALSDNAALNGFEFEIVPSALSETSGVMGFTEGLGPLNHLVAGATPGPARTTEVTTLDEVLGDRTADGVKIDVEGAERLVLEGARSALSEGRLRVIQLEYNDMSRVNYGESRAALRDLLAGYGYQFFRPNYDGELHPATRVGGGGGRDVFAILG
jgi:FkbM family methyltransferase